MNLILIEREACGGAVAGTYIGLVIHKANQRTRFRNIYVRVPSISNTN